MITRLYLIFFFVLISQALIAAPQKISGLYVNSFGNPSDQSIIFIHGGPGYDSQDFEFTTALPLSNQGFFVIVYDQRGQGRSDLATSPEEYSYKQYADDLKLIIDAFNLKKPILMGHSHGGPIALKFDQFYPNVVSKIVLVSGPINFFRSLSSIQNNCNARFLLANDSSNTAKLNNDFVVLTNRPSIATEIQTVGDIFQIALSKSCDLYTPAVPTEEAKSLHQIIAQNRVKVPQENLFYPMANFVINEQYIYLDQTEWVIRNSEHIYGIYGEEDGLFTKEILDEIKKNMVRNVSPIAFQVIPRASHAVYIDQRDLFIKAIKNIILGEH